jgi:hypothetical protein
MPISILFPTPLPYIADYVATTCRHPDHKAGYQQWLALVRAWHYDTDQVDDNGNLVWSEEYYQSLIDRMNEPDYGCSSSAPEAIVCSAVVDRLNSFTEYLTQLIA